jgi:hypothetical protein
MGKNKHVDLFKMIIPSVDQKVNGLWDAAGEEGQKEIQNDFWILNRYISSVSAPRNSYARLPTPTRKEIEWFVENVNEKYNKNWFAIQKHPKLLWLTLCSTAHDSRKDFSHEYIALKKQKNKKVEFLSTLFPEKKNADLETLALITTDKEIKEYCETLGWNKNEISRIKL